MSKNVFIPESELTGDLKICRSKNGNWYSANMWNAWRRNGVEGIEMSATDILSNLSVALNELEQAEIMLERARDRVAQLRQFGAALCSQECTLKAVAE